jgi:hypothetical protein
MRLGWWQELTARFFDAPCFHGQAIWLEGRFQRIVLVG